MGIENLKGLMDGLDPAALMPDLTTMIGKVELVLRIAVVLGPVVLLAMGLLYFFLPPKEANHYFGYRCFFGMGSLDAWRFTQRLAGLIFGALGLGLTVIMGLISLSFGGKEIMDMLWLAVKCMVWEAVLVGISCLFINIAAALRFDAKGERRKIEN